MVHALPLPGSPAWPGGSLARVIDHAVADGEALVAGGCDAIIVENMHDLPYLRGRVDPATTAAMAVVTHALTRLGVPIGVQVLAAANSEALGVAIAAGASFIRVEGFAYAHVADEGWMDACAGTLLRERHALRAEVAIYADIRKKHSAHAVTLDLSLGEIARGTAFSGADAVIVTGLSTGLEASPADVVEARVAHLPVLVGSGITPQNAGHFATLADGLIVGSWLKQDGDWRKAVDVTRVRAVRAAIDAALA